MQRAEDYRNERLDLSQESASKWVWQRGWTHWPQHNSAMR
jgi:hypothetical protein